MNKQQGIIVRNVLYNWLGFFVNCLVAFFLAPFIVHRLGDSIYGIWMLIGSATGYLGIMDLGIPPSVVKYVAQFRAAQDKVRLNQVVNTALLLFTVIGLSIFLASIPLSIYFRNIFKVSAHFDYVGVVVFLTCFELAMEIPLGTFKSVLSGLQRYDINSAIGIFSILARGGLIVLFLSRGGGLLALAIINLSVNIIAYLIALILSLKQCPELKLNPFNSTKKMARMLFGYSLPSFLIILGSRVIFQTDAIVIGIFLTSAAITHYVIAANLILYLRDFVMHMTNVISPAVSDMEQREQFDAIRSLLINSTKVLLLMVLPITAVALLMGRYFFTLWMGSAYASSAAILAILIIPEVFALAQYGAGSILFGLGKHKVLAFIIICEAMANLILSICLVRIYGIVGVALGTAIPLLFSYTFLLPLYTTRLLKLPILEYVKKSFIPPFISIIPFLVAISICLFFKPPETWGYFFGEAGGCFIIYIFFIFIICFDKEERLKVWLKVKSAFGS